MIRRILVGLGDRQYAAVATQTAVKLARIHGAELTGVSVLDTGRIRATGPVPVGAGHVAHELREHKLAQVKQIIEDVHREFEEACHGAEVRCRVECNEGDPYQCMIDRARYHDIVVCGLGHLFEHGVVDEPPEEFVRLVQSGVRPLIATADEYRPIERVLVAYSGSMESAKAMKRFVQLQLWPNVTMRIVSFDHPLDWADQLLSDAYEYCVAHGCDVDTGFLIKKQGLLPYAQEWRADLIVMGVSNRNLLLRRIFGEPMSRTLRNADRPLFLAQ